MAKVSVEIRGIEKLWRKVERMEFRSASSLEKTLAKAGLKVSGDAKKNLTTNKSVDTGLLRASIHISKLPSAGGKVGVAVGTNVEYAPYVEFGTGQRGASSNTNSEVAVSFDQKTVGQVAKPFLWPALRTNRKAIKEFVAEEVAKLSKGK